MTTTRKLSKYAKNACERSNLESAEKSGSSPKYLENPSTQVPQVQDCLECLKWLECPSVLSTRMLECLQNAYKIPTECPDGTKFWIFVCPNE